MFEHVTAQRVVRVYEEARPFEQRKEPRSGGAPGSPFLWLLSFGEAKESNLLSGNPRRFSMGIAALNPSYACYAASRSG